MSMSPIQFEAILEHLAENIAPGTMVIIKLFDDIAEEAAEGEVDPSSMLDEFNTEPSPLFGGVSEDAILMDNPLQT